jgi:hypothetical protein
VEEVYAEPEVGIAAIGAFGQDMEAVAYMMGVFEVVFAAGSQRCENWGYIAVADTTEYMMVDDMDLPVDLLD